MPFHENSSIIDIIAALEFSIIAQQHNVTPLYDPALMSSMNAQCLSNLLSCLNQYVPYSNESVSFYEQAINSNLDIKRIEPLLKILSRLGISFEAPLSPNQIRESELYHFIYRDLESAQKFCMGIDSALPKVAAWKLKPFLLEFFYLFPLSREMLPVYQLVIQTILTKPDLPATMSLIRALRETAPYNAQTESFYVQGLLNHLHLGTVHNLNILKKAGIVYSIETKAFFEQIVKLLFPTRYTSDCLSELFTLFNECGFPHITLNNSLYVKAIYSSIYHPMPEGQILNNTFNRINGMGLNLEQRRKLIFLILTVGFYPALPEDLEVLSQEGFTYSDETHSFYKTLFDIRGSASFNVLETIRILKKIMPYNATNELFYSHGLRHHRQAGKFSKIFKQAHQHGFSFTQPEHQFLYFAAMKSQASLNDLGKSWRIIKEIGPIIPDRNNFYAQLLILAENTPAIFKQLRALGCLYGEEQHSIYYNVLIQTSYTVISSGASSSISKSLPLLKAMNQMQCFYSEETKPIYKLLGQNDNTDYIISLAESGFQYTPETHAFFYSVLIEETKNYDDKIIFKELLTRGFPYSEENQTLYAVAFELDTNHAYRRESFLDMLSAFSPFQSKKTPELFAFLMHYPDVFLSYGFDLNEDTHIQFLEAHGVTISSSTSIPTFSELLSKQVQRALSERPELSLGNHTTQRLITEVFSLKVTPSLNQLLFLNSIHTYKQSVFMSNGPLIYNQSTRRLEELIVAVAENPQLFQFTYNKQLKEYILSELDTTSKIKQEINLSLLLKNANLTQLMTSAAKANPLLVKLSALLDDLIKKNQINLPETLTPEGAIKHLPEIFKKAIWIYSEGYYLDINRLFRGDELSGDASHNLEKDTLKLSFLVGILAAYALNMLPVIIHQEGVLKREKKIIKKLNQLDVPLQRINYQTYEALLRQGRLKKIISEKEYQLMIDHYYELIPLFTDQKFTLYRGEHYEDDNKKGNVIAYRTMGVTKLSSLTSTSHIPVSEFFYSEGENLYIFYENSPQYPSIRSLSNNEEENEVILPAGLQVMYLQEEQGLVARIISSPDYDHDEYWSQHALRFAYLNHLNRPYKDEIDFIMLDETEIHRPVHGLAHTQRVMSYIPLVIDYFAMHADNEEFRIYCQFIRNTEVAQMIKISAAFSVSGRESEVSFKDDPVKYEEYRRISCVNFLNYAALFPESCPPASLTWMGEIIQYMGNPEYSATINTRESLPIRQTLYSYYILSMAHKLDLLRCYDSDQVIRAFDNYEQLVRRSDLQKLHFGQLLRYALGLIGKHGDKRLCTMNENNQWVDDETEYNEPFSLVSRSPKDAEYFTAMIRKPILFDGCPQETDDEDVLAKSTQTTSAKRSSVTTEIEDRLPSKTPRLFQPIFEAKRKATEASKESGPSLRGG
ncbi:SidE phosphodiesterase domain-containing protein [Legionella yabuuchiae]|uniref:SidE phosphodiesterase domain-containing protein n=1 Tax=Legionella yabuuchiae TaxID=376727 RepID=UPI001054B948|nr:SidE phosphodiesterase domain-containing protein [Legionella yabuuchiae]